ncbi:MAG TPA: TlpA disulfide reductase family protein [Balneolales bacterium]|nr:TlpA disulfide reductase family protein [Balneolales bacterium]
MSKFSFSKRDIIEWIIIIVVGIVLYTTGWYVEVIGQLQRAILWTGIFKPNTHISAPSQKEADYNIPLITFNGQNVSLQQFRGKVIFINFWASWCPPCVAEMPDIYNLYKKVKSPDIAFLMISLDSNGEKAKKFIKRKGFTFPTYLLNGPLPSVYSTSAIPTTYVISKSGNIVAERHGMAEYNTASFRDFLKKQEQKSNPNIIQN